MFFNKRTYLLCGILLIGSVVGAYAQDQLLLEVNQARLEISKTSMFVLGGWAVGNIGISGILRGRSAGVRRYFHEMNVFWNLVNLGFVGVGLYGSYSSDPAALSLWEGFRDQQRLEKLLWFNVALNTSYMVTGAWLIERSKSATKRPERLKGYGQSLILQGGFLLVFDLAQVIAQSRATSGKLQQLLQQVSIGPEGVGIVWVF